MLSFYLIVIITIKSPFLIVKISSVVHETSSFNQKERSDLGHVCPICTRCIAQCDHRCYLQSNHLEIAAFLTEDTIVSSTPFDDL